MGCAGGGLAKTVINKLVGTAESQLATAQKQLDDQLKGAVDQIDAPVDKIVKDVEGQVAEKSVAAVEGLKAPLGAAVEQVKTPVDGALQGFKDKVAFDPEIVKKAAQPPLDEVNKQIDDQKNAAKKKVLDQLGEQVKKGDFLGKIGVKDGVKEIDKTSQIKISETVEQAIAPVRGPLETQVDGLVKQGKETITAAITPAIAPVQEVDGQVKQALETVEAPVQQIETQADDLLKPILDSVDGLIKGPVGQAAAAAKTPAETACNTALEGFEKAANLALENGKAGISKAPGAPAELVALGNEQLTAVVNMAKKKANNSVVKNKNLINDKVTKYETSTDDIVANVKKAPVKAVKDSFATVKKPLDDVKAPVTAPIQNVYDAVDSTKAFAFGELDKQQTGIEAFFDQLQLDGEKVIYDALEANGVKKA